VRIGCLERRLPDVVVFHEGHALAFDAVGHNLLGPDVACSFHAGESRVYGHFVVPSGIDQKYGATDHAVCAE